MITLWEHPLSPYAMKVKIALREKGLAFEARTPSGIGAGTAEQAFAAASPLGEVPCLIDGDVTLFDSTIILEYLEAAYPKPDLLPDHPRLAAKARTIEEICDTRYEAITWAVSEILNFKRAEGGAAEALLDRARRQLAGLHAWLEAQLPERGWFCPPHFGWADLVCAPFVAGAAGFGMGPARDSRLGSWLAAALGRESVAQTLAEARAAAGDMAAVDRLVKARLFKRQYRDHRLEWMMRSGGAEIVAQGLANGTIRFSPDLDAGALP